MLLYTLEGFSPSALSCYGASWNRTESLDSLAASGTTWDRIVTPVADPVEQLDRWLTSKGFPAEEMTVVTDDERISELVSSDRIGELIVIPPRSLAVAESLEETSLAALAAIAAEQLPDNPHVWLHSRFLTRAWDAPRNLFPLDQFDEDALAPLDPSETLEQELGHPEDSGDWDDSVPAILDSWQPPDETLRSNTHPDLIMAWMRTYGCQIRLVDTIGGLLNEMARASGHAVMIVAGSSGFSLGQNGAIGHRTGPLRSCHLHVPLLAAGLTDAATGISSGTTGAGIRQRRVHSADELPDVVSHFLNSPHSSPISPQTWADRGGQTSSGIVTRSVDQALAITTEQWFFVRQDALRETPASAPGQLFLKPDDLHDTNDVARLKPEIVEELDQRLAGEGTSQ